MISTENLDTPLPPLIHELFRYRKFCETETEGFPYEVSRFVRQQIFIENRDVPFVGIKLFDTRSFLKHRRVPLRNDSVLPDKTISTENRDTRPLFHPYHFSISETF